MALDAIVNSSASMATHIGRLAAKDTNLARARLPSRPIAAVGGSGPYVGRLWLCSVLRRSPTSLGGQLGCQSTHLGLFVIMKPSVRDESDQIVNTFFRTKWQNFAVDPSQKEPYFKVTILNL